LEKINLGKIVTSVADNLKSAAMEKHLTVSLSRFPEMPGIKADKLRITQVMNNLLANAIKFTPENGRINIKVRKTKKNLTVIIEDSGIGIDPKYFENLFTPFFQIDSSLRRRYRGTGLGLVICKGIIDAHGGSLRVASGGEGKGSTFCFSLPVVE
jgi:signal transduction histidine kinase